MRLPAGLQGRIGMRRPLDLWLRMSNEQRFYSGGVLLSFSVLMFTVMQVLRAQNLLPTVRLPEVSIPALAIPELRFPTLADLVPVAEPVMVPAQQSEMVTAQSAPITSGETSVAIGTSVLARLVLGNGVLPNPAFLLVRDNLASLAAPAPPISDFRTLHLTEISFLDVSTRTPTNPAGMRVDVRILIRAADLEMVRGDPSRLILLHFHPTTRTWEDTRAQVDGDHLIASVSELSVFVVGFSESRATAIPLTTPTSGATPTAAATPSPAGTSPPAETPGAEETLTAVVEPALVEPTASVGPSPTPRPTETVIPTATPAPSSTLRPATALPTPTPLPSIVSITTPGSEGGILTRFNAEGGSRASHDLVIHNAGNVAVNYSLATQFPVSSPLDDPAAVGRSPADGLQLTILRCSPQFSSCGTSVYTGPARISDTRVGALAPATDDFLRLTLELPSTVPNTFQGRTSVLDLVWTAQERA